MIRIPFQYDGIGYFGWLAHGYLKDFLPALVHLNNEQAPIYYFLHLLLTWTFGFSYPTVLLVQATLVFLLFILVIRISVPKNDFAMAALISTSLLLCSGILQYQVGGLLDFRIDLWGSLILSLALTSFRFNNLWTVLAIAIAISERFHNISVLLGTGAALVALDLMQSKRKSFKTLSTYRPLGLAILGLFVVGILRIEYFEHMWSHYRSHLMIGIDDTYKSFMFSNRDAPGFYTFYWNALWNSFFIKELRFFVILIGLSLVYSYYRFRPKFMATASSPLLVGSVIALVLLHINLARNNEGVLRYFLVPFIIWLSLEFAHYLKRISFPEKTTRYLLAVLVLSGWVAGLRAQVSAVKSLDYKGLQSKKLGDQIFTLNAAIYERFTAKGISNISLASTFQSDYALSDLKLWTAFLAEKRIFDPKVQLSEAFGSLLFSSDPNSIRELISKADIVLLGEGACLDEPIPVNRQLKVLFSDIEQDVRSRCHSKIGTLESNCKAELLDCTP